VRRLLGGVAIALATAGLAAPVALAGPDVTLLATVGPAADVQGPRPGPTTLGLRISIPETPQPAPWTTLTLALDPAVTLTAQAEGATVGSETSAQIIGTTGFPQPGGQQCSGSGPITQAAAGGYGIRFQSTKETGCAAPMDYTFPAAVTVGAPGTTLTVTTPDEMRHPISGIDTIVSLLDLRFDSGVALTSCPPNGSVAFIATLQHEDGFSSTSSAAARCRPALVPLAVRPLLTLSATPRGGRVLGRLLGLRAAPGLKAGVVELRCTVGACPRKKLGSRTLRGGERSPLLTLSRPLKVTAATRVAVNVTDLDGQRATYPFRFARTKAGLVARPAR
jgi:hypothetical protein